MEQEQEQDWEQDQAVILSTVVRGRRTTGMQTPDLTVSARQLSLNGPSTGVNWLEGPREGNDTGRDVEEVGEGKRGRPALKKNKRKGSVIDKKMERGKLSVCAL